MAITTDQVMADTVPTVLESARYTAEFLAEMSKLVWNIQKALHDGKNLNIPLFGTVAARALAEGIDNVVSETMSDSLVTITPGEVGCKIILTDKLVRDNNEDIKAAAGRLLGNAMEVKRDQDLLLQFQSAATTLGAGTTMTMGQAAAARAIIKGVPVSSGGPGPGTPVIVHHPYVTLDLVDVMTPLVPTSAGSTGTPIWKSRWVRPSRCRARSVRPAATVQTPCTSWAASSRPTAGPLCTSAFRRTSTC